MARLPLCGWCTKKQRGWPRGTLAGLRVLGFRAREWAQGNVFAHTRVNHRQ